MKTILLIILLFFAGCGDLEYDGDYQENGCIVCYDSTDILGNPTTVCENGGFADC
tara:strand:- start:357 stop:521 length:165 start_codon:yes stop_codon:yes gene_type:complete